MDLKDAMLMLLSESADHPALASLAQSAYDQILEGEPVDYRVLNEVLGEASGKGVLRAIHAKYGPTAYNAMLTPIMAEIASQPPSAPTAQPPCRRPPNSTNLATR